MRRCILHYLIYVDTNIFHLSQNNNNAMQGWPQDKLAVQLVTVTARSQSAILHNNNKY